MKSDKVTRKDLDDLISDLIFTAYEQNKLKIGIEYLSNQLFDQILTTRLENYYMKPNGAELISELYAKLYPTSKWELWHWWNRMYTACMAQVRKAVLNTNRSGQYYKFSLNAPYHMERAEKEAAKSLIEEAEYATPLKVRPAFMSTVMSDIKKNLRHPDDVHYNVNDKENKLEIIYKGTKDIEIMSPGNVSDMDLFNYIALTYDTFIKNLSNNQTIALNGVNYYLIKKPTNVRQAS